MTQGFGRRSRSFFIHKADVLRASFAVDVTVIRDKKILDFVTIYRNIPCWKQHNGSQLIDTEIGRVPVDSYTFWFDSAGAGIQINDRLKVGTNYYWVEGLIKNSDEDFHIQVSARLLNLTQS